MQKEALYRTYGQGMKLIVKSVLRSIVNCQVLTVNYQRSSVNCQVLTVNYQVSTVNLGWHSGPPYIQPQQKMLSAVKTNKAEAIHTSKTN